MEARVFLMKEISESQRIQVEQTLANSDYVLSKDGAQVMTYISKEQASKEFVESTGEDFKELLGDNPLRDSYIINIAYEYQTAEKLAELRTSIEALSGVFEFDYVESVYTKIVDNVTTIGFILMAFAGVLFIAVILLINNTIKLALFSQRFLIRSMQLVGAKSGFIRQPFLARSMLHGITAGILASIGLYVLLDLGQTKFPQLTTVTEMQSVFILFVGVVIMGALVGFMGTYLAIRKYLRMSLDELY